MKSELRDRREAVVRAHVSSENAHDFAATVGTFTRPRYEVSSTGDVHDGAAAVTEFLVTAHRAFPDMRLDPVAVHHADEAVIVETMFSGTHRGTWRGLPPTGRPVRYAMCNLFLFEGSDLVCERLNFDLLTVLRQLGIASDPTSPVGRFHAALCHPVVVGSAVLRSWFGAR